MSLKYSNDEKLSEYGNGKMTDCQTNRVKLRAKRQSQVFEHLFKKGWDFSPRKQASPKIELKYNL